MGIDLKVMASYLRERRNELLSTASLRFERDPGLFSKLSKDAVPCLVHPLPSGLKIGNYDDAGLAFTDVDRYGQPLMYITSTGLTELTPPIGLSSWNQAVLAFLMHLPDDVRIVLYWC